MYPVEPNNVKAIDTKLNVLCLSLLRELLDSRGGKTGNQDEMLRFKGFPIISFLLQKSPPEHLTFEALKTAKSNFLFFFSYFNELFRNVFKNYQFRYQPQKQNYF